MGKEIGKEQKKGTTAAKTTAAKTVAAKTAAAKPVKAEEAVKETKAAAVMDTASAALEQEEALYQERFQRHLDELKWLYMEMYDNGSMFAELCDNLHRFYTERNETLKTLDRSRELEPGWYKKNDMLGMMFYIDNFAGNMRGVESKLDYLEKSNVNYIHLMPFLDTTEGRSDGG